MTSDQDRFLRSKLSEDSAHLVKENALLNQQVLELTKQLNRVRRPHGAGCRDRTRVWGLPDPAGPRAHQAARQGASSTWGRVQGQSQGAGTESGCRDRVRVQGLLHPRGRSRV